MSDTITLRLGLDPDWRERGTCRRVTGVDFYPDRGRNDLLHAAREVCRSCPVLDACGVWAMTYEAGVGRDARYGVWAGMTGKERYELERALNRRSQDAEAAA